MARRRDWAVNAPQPRGDRGSGILVFEMQLDQWREAEAQAVGVGLGKSFAQDLVEQKSGFEVGAGWGVLDGPHAIAQI